MKRWGIWISQTLNADGMRLDALKHIKNAFIADFMHSVRTSRGKEFYAVGEYWSGDFESLEAYLDAVDHQIDLFDAPLHFKLFTASQQGRDFDMRTLLDDTLVQKYPTLAVTVRGQPRLAARQFARIAGQIVVQTAGIRTDPADERGVSLRLLRRLLQHERRRVAPPPRPRYSARCPPLRAFGEQTDYFDHPNTVGFTRSGDERHPDSGLALLLSNGEDGEKVMSVGVAHANETWHEITGSYDDELTIGDDGKALFKVHGGKLAVWVRKKD